MKAGTLRLRMLDEDRWDPSTTVKDILLAVQDILHNPNLKATTQIFASYLYR